MTALPTPIRIGIIGLGYRGRYLRQLLAQMPEANVVALADPALQDGDAQAYGARVYNRGVQDYERMLRQEALELVLVAVPWQEQIAIAQHCLEAGVHLALEIRGGDQLGEYTQLLEAQRTGGLQVYPLENTLFMRETMAIGCMVRAGVLGQIVYMRGGYRHDLRHILLGAQGQLGNDAPESSWRSPIYAQRNADLYPTHGLAPLWLYADLGRSDTPTSLVSLSSAPRGIDACLASRGQAPLGQAIRTGDVVTTHITTANGVLISLTHDTTLPRPRSLDFEVQGTRGIWQGDQRRIYIEGESEREQWQSDEPYIQQWEHPLWQAWGAEALRIDAHHSGMDYVMLRAALYSLRGLAEYPASLSDLAGWCAVTPLSERSIAEGVAVPFAYP